MTKIKSLILTLMFLLIAGTLSAQLRYYEGKLSINDAPADPDYELTINGWRGLRWTPKEGCFLLMDLFVAAPAIAGHGDQIAFFNPETKNFNSLLVSNVYNMSDARAKKNVSSLSDCMTNILSLRPVSYQWVQSEGQTSRVADGTLSTKTPKGASSDNATQYGFIAQEVEEVMPEAVKTLEDGSKLINYNAFIPLLVESIQSLQKTVEEQSVVISQLSDKLQLSARNLAAEDQFTITPTRVQNSATLDYQISTHGTAILKVSDLVGNIKKEVALSRDCESLSIDFSSLTPGLYVAAILVDDTVVGSTRIIKE